VIESNKALEKNYADLTVSVLFKKPHSWFLLKSHLEVWQKFTLKAWLHVANNWLLLGVEDMLDVKQ